MPEGDTVLRTARRLHQALAGRPLLDAELRWPGLSTANLRGMTVLEVVARGKHLLTRLDSGWTLHSHLRMEGQWRVERTDGGVITHRIPAHPTGSPKATPGTDIPGTSPTLGGAGTSIPGRESTLWSSGTDIPETGPAPGRTGTDIPGTGPTLRSSGTDIPGTGPTLGSSGTGIPGTGRAPEGAGEPGSPRKSRTGFANHPDARAILVGPEWTAIGLRLGMLDLVRTAEEHTLVGHLGPDILAPDFDRDQAVTNLAASPMPIGAALLDQRNLAGIGTLWSSESLFLERMDPWAAAGQLGSESLTRLVDRARRLMVANADFAVQSSTGNRAEGQTSYVHARSGRPCRRCGGTVRVAAIGPPTQERTMFYCPRCQGGLAPTDDGRPMAPLGARRRESPGRRGPGP